MTKEEYHAYLASPQWAVKRRDALARAGHRCQLCNGAGTLNVHHRTYERVGREDPGDLTVLCRGCHEHFHGVATGSGRSVKRGRSAKAKRAPIPVHADRALEGALEMLEPGVVYTTHEVAALAHLSAARTGSRLAALARRGAVERAGRKRWRRPDGLTNGERRMQRALESLMADPGRARVVDRRAAAS